MEERKNTEEREHILNLLKGICIIMVIMTHWAWTDIERRQMLFPWWVDMAVPIFIMISGYVYYKSYERNGIINCRRQITDCWYSGIYS